MTESEFRADLLTSAASRSEVQSCGLREAFVTEVLERLRDAGEVPEGEPCPESITGQRGRKLEIDAWADDDADGSLHLFIALYVGGPQSNSSLTLTEARDQGFNPYSANRRSRSTNFGNPTRQALQLALKNPGKRL